MKKILLFLLLSTLSFKTYPCGNEYGYTLDGERQYTRYFFLSERMLHFDEVKIKTKLSKLREKVNDGSANYKTHSDIALNLMKLGKADSSVLLLRSLLRDYPDEYNINANLGTAYELTGKLDSALKYISRGVEINATSHRGSEWVHVKILEAKIKEKKYRGWIDTHPIIELNDLLQKIDSANKRHELSTINHQVFYQIRTRAPFTPAPNKVLANILVTLGDFNAKVETYENALLAYANAINYEPSPYIQRKIKEKITALNRKRKAHPKEVPSEFIRFMTRAEISPDLLLLGLDDFTEKLDSIHLDEVSKNDSLEILKNKIDSLVQNSEAQLKSQKDTDSNQSNPLYIGMGLLVGIGLTLTVLRKRKD